jgi:hypothetical protein
MSGHAIHDVTPALSSWSARHTQHVQGSPAVHCTAKCLSVWRASRSTARVNFVHGQVKPRCWLDTPLETLLWYHFCTGCPPLQQPRHPHTRHAYSSPLRQHTPQLAHGQQQPRHLHHHAHRYALPADTSATLAHAQQQMARLYAQIHSTGSTGQA